MLLVSRHSYSIACIQLYLAGGESLGTFTYAEFSGLLMVFSHLGVMSKEIKTLQ